LHEEARLEMKKLIPKLITVMMLCLVSAGSFAQKRDDGKRPPKETTKVVVPDKKDKPQQNPEKPKNNDKRGKP
jgi:hypothetical protein